MRTISSRICFPAGELREEQLEREEVGHGDHAMPGGLS